MPSLHRAVWTGLALLLLGPALPGSARAEGADPRAVPLDALFRLPAAAPQPAGSERQAADRERWRQRFANQRRDLDEARRLLAESQTELEELAQGADGWQIAAPGAERSAENSPLSYKLREEIRRRREAVTREERALLELEAEASLAGIPSEWRQAEAEAR